MKLPMPNRAIIDHEMFAKLRERYQYSWILLRELVRTDFKLRYQGSALGYVWSLLRPLFIFIILYFVFIHFLRIQGGQHWPVAMLLGIVLWNFFGDITNGGVGAIVGKGDLIRKVNFPKYIIILAGSFSALINLFFNLIVIAVFMILSRVDLSWSALLTPLWILEIFIFAIGISFILSTLFVKFRDVNYIWEIIMQGLFYISPVVYPIAMVVERNVTIAQIIMLNPVAQAIQGARHDLVDISNMTLTQISGGNWLINLVPLVIVLGTLVLGIWLFRKNSPNFAEEV